MRKSQAFPFGLLLAGLSLQAETLSAASPNKNPNVGPDYWMPTLGTIRKIEPTVEMPAGAKKLADYTRYYAGSFDGAERVIVGMYLYAPTAKALGLRGNGVVIVRGTNKLPVVSDGGCSVVSIVYYVSSNLMRAIACGGVS